MSLLDKIAILRGTDKSSEVHNYCIKYEKYLPFKRTDKICLLEIGVQGGNSLRMWKDYFFQSNIIGIDINDTCKAHEEERIFIEIGSQVDINFLKQIGNKYGMFDIILDDGSHINKDVICSFENLYKFVKPGGVYVIEDTCTSYWKDYGGGYNETMVEYFKNLIEDVNLKAQVNYDYYNANARREDKMIPFLLKHNIDCITDIESINFLNGIIIITKTNGSL
jgi:cephalosporin hydroxylase